MRLITRLFWRRGMAGPVLVHAEAEADPFSGLREITPVHECDHELPAYQAFETELFEPLCRACTGCDGLHHWMFDFPSDDPEDLEHPAVQDGHVLGYFACKHCGAWAGMAEDDDEEAGPPDPTPATIDRFRTPCCNAVPLMRLLKVAREFTCPGCYAEHTAWQLLYRPAPITFSDQDLVETMEAANLSEQPGMSIDATIAGLERELQSAVADANYDRASGLRDALRGARKARERVYPPGEDA